MWPIAHAKAPTDDAEAALHKSQAAPEQATANDASSPSKKRKLGTPKKQENAMLLFYAMRTTAAEKQQSPEPALPNAGPSIERSSAASPSETSGPSPAGPGSFSEETSKGGKKKRKRKSVPFTLPTSIRYITF